MPHLSPPVYYDITIWIYTLLYLVTIDVIFYQVKMLVFYNVQTTNMIFIDKYKICCK